MDVYRKFAELKKAEREDIDYSVYVVRREDSSIVVVAPHGGRIEPGTSEVATKIAGEDFSLALFEGTKSSGNTGLHITSTRFDEPRCLELVQATDTAVTIHGEKSKEPVVFLGGRDKKLAAQIRAALESHGFEVRVHKNSHLQGTAIKNICNRGRRGAGVQLELSSGLRQTIFKVSTTEGNKTPTVELAKFADAIREGLRADD